MLKELNKPNGGEARLILVRHGETDENGFMSGKQADPKLNAEGVNQALRASSVLKAVSNGALLLSSTRQRAFETLLVATGRMPKVTPLLDEGEFGDLEGVKVDEPIIANLRNPITRDHKWVTDFSFESDESIIDRQEELIGEYWKDMQNNITLWGGHARWMAPVIRPAFLAQGCTITKIDNLAIAVFDVKKTDAGWEKTLVESSGIRTAPARL